MQLVEQKWAGFEEGCAEDALRGSAQFTLCIKFADGATLIATVGTQENRRPPIVLSTIVTPVSPGVSQ